MPTLPVWIEGWQLGCCGQEHVAEVGKSWQEMLLISVAHFEQAKGRELGWEILPEGRIAFYAHVLNSSRRPTQPILDLGDCRVGRGSQDIRAAGVIAGEGRVFADWHGGFGDPERDADIVVSDTVRRIRVYNSIMERDPAVSEVPLMRFVGYEDPTDIEVMTRSTGRRRFDVLVDLDVGS